MTDVGPDDATRPAVVRGAYYWVTNGCIKNFAQDDPQGEHPWMTILSEQIDNGPRMTFLALRSTSEKYGELWDDAHAWNHEPGESDCRLHDPAFVGETFRALHNRYFYKRQVARFACRPPLDDGWSRAEPKDVLRLYRTWRGAARNPDSTRYAQDPSKIDAVVKARRPKKRKPEPVRQADENTRVGHVTDDHPRPSRNGRS